MDQKLIIRVRDTVWSQMPRKNLTLVGFWIKDVGFKNKSGLRSFKLYFLASDVQFNFCQEDKNNEVKGEVWYHKSHYFFAFFIWAASWQNQQNGMCPAKTQISLVIRPIWPESLMCAHCVAKGPSFLHADSEDSEQTGWMPRLIWVFSGCNAILLVLSWGSSFRDFRIIDLFADTKIHNT